VQTVHLNIGWLPSDSKIYLAKRAAAKRTAEVTHRAIRCLVSKPDEHCGNLECPRKPTTFIRDLARVSQARHGALLRRSASIAGGSEIRSRASKRSPLRSTAMSKRTREEKSAKSQQLAKPDAISIGRRVTGHQYLSQLMGLGSNGTEKAVKE
jgi:hypothetical protein